MEMNDEGPPKAKTFLGILVGYLITWFSSLTGYNYKEDRVVKDGTLITSRGPGTCFEYALAIVEALQGKEKRDSIMPPMLLPESIK